MSLLFQSCIFTFDTIFFVMSASYLLENLSTQKYLLRLLPFIRHRRADFDLSMLLLPYLPSSLGKKSVFFNWTLFFIIIIRLSFPIFVKPFCLWLLMLLLLNIRFIITII